MSHGFCPLLLLVAVTLRGPQGRKFLWRNAAHVLGRERIRSLPRFTEGDFVFTTTAGRRPVSGFSKAKIRTDQILAKHKTTIENWRVHDLRRTCRSEMARLGVPEIVGECVLNHLPKGLAKTYNVHEYLDEKREALADWAQEIQNWTEPPPDNVMKFKTEGRN